MAWQSLQTAPRDAFIWLFLPASKYETNPDGTPKPGTIEHECVLAKWDPVQGAWVTRENRHVYPSVWSDADIGGAAPAQPEMTA